MEYYFESYGDVALQRLMVSDEPRTEAFAKAIAEVVQAGDRVLDVGTGTGLLAMLSAKAGAEKVHGIDQATIGALAKQLVKHNGLADKVEILDGDASELELDEKVDVLVSEWLGHFGFVEHMMDDVMDARDRNLKPGGIMLPAGIDLVLAPTSTGGTYERYGPGFWKKPVQGLDFSMLERQELHQAMAKKADVPLDTLIAKEQILYGLDMVSATKEDPWQSGEVSFTIERDATLDGFLGWFVTQLSPSVDLDTGPRHPYTHWEQAHMLFPPRAVKEGQEITVAFSLEPHPYSRRSVLFSLDWDGERFAYTIE